MWYSTWSIIICREVAEEKIAKTKKNSLPKYHILFLNFSLCLIKLIGTKFIKVAQYG